MKRYFILYILCVVNLCVRAEIKVSRLTASELKSAEYTIGKIVMHDGILSLISTNGLVLANEPIDHLVRIVFIRTTTGMETIPQSAMRIYPNPATDLIIVEGLGEEVLYRIYDMSGKCVTAGQGTSVPVQGLSDGTYILQVDTQLMKFIKD